MFAQAALAKIYLRRLQADCVLERDFLLGKWNQKIGSTQPSFSTRASIQIVLFLTVAISQHLLKREEIWWHISDFMLVHLNYILRWVILNLNALCLACTQSCLFARFWAIHRMLLKVPSENMQYYRLPCAIYLLHPKKLWDSQRNLGQPQYSELPTAICFWDQVEISSG